MSFSEGEAEFESKPLWNTGVVHVGLTQRYITRKGFLFLFLNVSYGEGIDAERQPGCWEGGEIEPLLAAPLQGSESLPWRPPV